MRCWAADHDPVGRQLPGVRSPQDVEGATTDQVLPRLYTPGGRFGIPSPPSLLSAAGKVAIG
jgi:hypothetical protein